MTQAGASSSRRIVKVERPISHLRARHAGSRLEIYETSSGNLDLSAIVVPAESRGSGVGTQIMTELCELADRAGRTITLTPASDYGGSKTRLVGFYKRFGFVENKGRGKDFSISAGMYRRPA